MPACAEICLPVSTTANPSVSASTDAAVINPNPGTLVNNSKVAYNVSSERMIAWMTVSSSKICCLGKAMRVLSNAATV
ncbi:hypothetical protein SAMN00790413_03358 [Deinococcus hopiensis KR-140]|uniref:Uncharacterized protein n=1 Tax=Deinococcus hopiensis KR-140 TaxID=695939 RepID=A0A1W1UWA2_9DEIO|nr:hypothetical protein SAMN00790413_03358 [Deinococcus hopiensis KR-140]